MAMKKESGPKPPMDPKTAKRLLDLLGTDNSFRRQFKKSPGVALGSLGYEGAMSCKSVEAIAPKSELMASRDELHEHLTTKGAFTVPHCFEAGKVAKAVRLK
jgi:putative modified peptide